MFLRIVFLIISIVICDASGAEFNTKSHKVIDTRTINLKSNNNLWIADASSRAALSTAWYNPEQDGHGFQFSFADGVAIISWYVYRNGSQFWLNGSSSFDGSLNFDVDMYETGGAFFPPNFDTSQVQANLWGTLNINIESCFSGFVTWSSANGQLNGSMPIQPIAFSNHLCHIHNEPMQDASFNLPTCNTFDLSGSINDERSILINTNESITIIGDLWGPNDIDVYRIEAENSSFDLDNYPNYYSYTLADSVKRFGIYTSPDFSNASSKTFGCKDWTAGSLSDQTRPGFRWISSFGLPNILELPYRIESPELEEFSYNWAQNKNHIAFEPRDNPLEDYPLVYSFSVSGEVNNGTNPDPDPPNPGSNSIMSCIQFFPNDTGATAFGYFVSTCSDINYPLGVSYCFVSDEEFFSCSVASNNNNGWSATAILSGVNDKEYFIGPEGNATVYFAACDNFLIPRISGDLVNGAPQSFTCI